MLFYSDGVVEARDSRGEFSGEGRLADSAERALGTGDAAELVVAVLEHQGGELQEEATLVMDDWPRDAHRAMFPRSVADGR